MTTLAESAKYHALMLMALNRCLRSRDPRPSIDPENLIPGLTEESLAFDRATNPDIDLAIDAIHELQRQGMLTGDESQCGFYQAWLTPDGLARLRQRHGNTSAAEGISAWAAGLGLAGVNGLSEGQAAEVIALSRLLRLA